MSFTSMHYQCCPVVDEPTIQLQQQILVAISDLSSQQSADHAQSSNERQQLLDELSKITQPTVN